MSHAILFDAHLCTACRGCQVACKQWNDLEAEETKNTGSYQNPPRLSSDTWLVMRFNELEDEDGKPVWAFGRHACMHCEHPGCVSACPVGALKKSDEGPVLWNEDRCIGCRYCMIACPFDVPTFTWDAGLAEGTKIRKCTFCIDRISNGLEPACVHTCPSGALKYGQRDELIAYSEERIRKYPDTYIPHVYGTTEGGGTHLLYISHVPFTELGLPELDDKPVGDVSETIMKSTPFVAVGWAAILAGIWWVVGRRNQMMSKSGSRE